MTFQTSSSEAALQRSMFDKQRDLFIKRVIDMDHDSFKPLVFTPYGGCGREAERCITELSRLIAVKRGINANIVTNWLRTTISFTLITSAVLCLRGSRSIRKANDINGEDIEITNHVGRIFFFKL